MSYTEQDAVAHGEMLGNRCKKALKKLAPVFKRRGIEAFRLYDWDIPEVRAIVDWYAGHLVISEYERTQTQTVKDWLGTVSALAAQALLVPPSHVHVRRRHTGTGTRYDKQAPNDGFSDGGLRLSVREGDLHFLVNLDTYLDTGLFADHRLTRERIQREAKGKRVLNLFCYTGSFTCYAALGGARGTTSVDASNTYLEWAKENLELNRLTHQRHEFVKDDVLEFLYFEDARAQRYDLCIVDPPSFSIGRGRDSFDVQRDQGKLLTRVAKLMNPGGTIYFSTNHQRFAPELEGIPGVTSVADITKETIDIDYRNPKVHQCFMLKVGD